MRFQLQSAATCRGTRSSFSARQGFIANELVHLRNASLPIRIFICELQIYHSRELEEQTLHGQHNRRKMTKSCQADGGFGVSIAIKRINSPRKDYRGKTEATDGRQPLRQSREPVTYICRNPAV